MFEIVEDAGPWVYYKLTYEPIAKNSHKISNKIVWLQLDANYMDWSIVCQG